MLGVFYDNYCLVIGSFDGAALERNTFERKAILFSLAWDSVNDCKACFDKTAHWDNTL